MLVNHCRLNANIIFLKHWRFGDRMNNFKVNHNRFNSFIYFRSSLFFWNCLQLKFWYNNKSTVSPNELLAFFVHGAKNLVQWMESKRVFIKQIHRHRTDCAMLIWLNIAYVHFVIYVAHWLSSSLGFRIGCRLHSSTLMDKKLILVILVLRWGSFWMNWLLTEWIIVRTKHGLGPLLLFGHIHCSIVIIIHSLVVHILRWVSIHLLLLLIIKVRLCVWQLILKYLLNIFWNI